MWRLVSWSIQRPLKRSLLLGGLTWSLILFGWMYGGLLIAIGIFLGFSIINIMVQRAAIRMYGPVGLIDVLLTHLIIETGWKWPNEMLKRL